MVLFRPFRYYYLKFLRLKGSPKALAMGTAIGIFVGLTPTMPFHTVLILTASMLTRSSGIAGIIVSWIVCNPFTCFPIYYIALKVGNMVTPYSLDWSHIETLLSLVVSHSSFAEIWQAFAKLGYEAITILVTGGIILAFPASIIGYYYSLRLFTKIYEKRQRKKLKHLTSDPS